MAEQQSVTPLPGPARRSPENACRNGLAERSVRVLTDPVAADAAARPALAADPVGHNVIGTVLAAAQAGPLPPDAMWAVVEDGDGRPVGVAARCGSPLWSLGPMPDGAADAVARTLHRRGHDVPSVAGDLAATTAFVRTWAHVSGAPARQTEDEGIRVLTRPAAPMGVPGRARAATSADEALVVDWLGAFDAEAHPHGPPVPVDADRVRRRIAAGTIVLWTDGGTPVCLAGWHPPVHGVGRIGPVWTPPEHRRRGYAAAATWAAALAVRAAGGERVMLFTDLTNATSNGVYARLGFELVSRAAHWALG